MDVACCSQRWHGSVGVGVVARRCSRRDHAVPSPCGVWWKPLGEEEVERRPLAMMGQGNELGRAESQRWIKSGRLPPLVTGRRSLSGFSGRGASRRRWRHHCLCHHHHGRLHPTLVLVPPSPPHQSTTVSLRSPTQPALPAAGKSPSAGLRNSRGSYGHRERAAAVPAGWHRSLLEDGSSQAR